MVIVVIHDKTLLCLAELIHTDKMKLGIHLGFKHDDVKRISGDHPTDAVSAVMEILTVTMASAIPPYCKYDICHKRTSCAVVLKSRYSDIAFVKVTNIEMKCQNQYQLCIFRKISK